MSKSRQSKSPGANRTRSANQMNARHRAAAREAERKRRATIRRNVLISGSLLAVAALVIGIVVAVGSARDGQASSATDLVRSDSTYLNRPAEAKVTVVEFLDFECPACAALYPTMEQTRHTYGDRVNFVVRHFPLDMHFNAKRAARAVEAAGQQGKWEPMYDRMFQSQTQWANQQVPQDEIFRGYARDLGLDMTAWEAAYNDPAVQRKITADQSDGLKLDVQSTPTVFVNGEQLQMRSYAELPKAIESALAAQ